MNCVIFFPGIRRLKTRFTVALNTVVGFLFGNDALVTPGHSYPSIALGYYRFPPHLGVKLYTQDCSSCLMWSIFYTLDGWRSKKQKDWLSCFACAKWGHITKKSYFSVFAGTVSYLCDLTVFARRTWADLCGNWCIMLYVLIYQTCTGTLSSALKKRSCSLCFCVEMWSRYLPRG